jgi:hypothetical protein
MNFYEAIEELLKGKKVTNDITGHVYNMRNVIICDGKFSDTYPTADEVNSKTWSVLE